MLFFLFFRWRNSPEISKNVQGTLGQCPPSMDTTDACSLFPRNVNYLTVRPPLGCGLKKSDLGESPFLHDWPPIRLMQIWPEMTSRPTKLSTTSHWGLWPLILSLWVTSGQENKICASTSKLKFSHFGCCPLIFFCHVCIQGIQKLWLLGNHGYFHVFGTTHLYSCVPKFHLFLVLFKIFYPVVTLLFFSINYQIFYF